MTLTSDAKLQWVLVDGKPQYVGKFAHLPPSDRPQARCPVCNQLVILKLGQIRVFHAAHQEESNCAAIEPETALHLNVKYHLLHELSKSNSISVLQNCVGWSEDNSGHHRHETCDDQRPVIIASNWDEVEVECSIDRYYIDVALKNESQPLLAIEVYVTHHLEDDKKAFLRENGIPWIEIEACEEFYSGESPWTSDIPLTPLSENLPELARDWRCQTCSDKLEKVARCARAREKWKAEGRVINTKIRLLDIYYPSGKRFREIICRKCDMNPGDEIISARLEVGDYKKGKTKVIARLQRPIKPTDLPLLDNFYELFISGLRNKGYLIDSPMSWQDWPKGLSRNDVFFETVWFPVRYLWVHDQWIQKYAYEKFSWDGYWKDTQIYQKELRRAEAALDPKSNPNPTKKKTNAELQPTYQPFSKPAVCIYCGETTTDYWYYDGHGNCKCRSCLAKGKP